MLEMAQIETICSARCTHCGALNTFPGVLAARRQFKDSGNPLIYTFFKDADIKTSSARKEDLSSLWAFQEKLDTLGHFRTNCTDIEHLKRQFRDQRDNIMERYD
jgi:hypothetical protein